jgi:hypothetical protein
MFSGYATSVTVGNLPLSSRSDRLLRASGCIVLRAIAVLLRRKLLEIAVRILAKLRRTGATAGGVGTEAAERNLSEIESGPTSAS